MKALLLALLIMIGVGNFGIPMQVQQYLNREDPERITYTLLTCEDQPCVFVVIWYDAKDNIVGVGYFNVVARGRWELGIMYYFADKHGRCMLGCELNNKMEMISG